VPPVKERLSERELLRCIGDVHGVISGDDEFTVRVFEAAPKLKVISKWGTGIDSIDTVVAKKLGIAVRNTAGAFTEPVADQVMGFILSFARQIPWINDDVHAGKWCKKECAALSTKTIGVMGVGRIGKAVIYRAKAFGMRLLGNDIVDMPDVFLTETAITMTDKETVLRESDFISLNCHLNPKSLRLLSDPEFDLVKSTALVINTARGSIVDEPALIRALKAKRIAGAALDVFEQEPLPNDHPFLKMPNVLLSPHNSNSSPEHWQIVHEATLTNLLEELNK